jgi:hypothetical protein
MPSSSPKHRWRQQ